MLKKLCNVLIELGIIALIIFPPIVFGAVQSRHVMYIHIIILGIGLLWCVKAFSKHSITYLPTPIDLPILLFLGVGLVNIATSTYRHNTEQAWYLWLNYALLYFLVVQQLRKIRRIVGLAFLLVLIGSGESLFGLFQYMQGAKTVLGYATPNIGTVNATYFSHNHFAGFLILILPVAIGLFIGSANIEKKVFLFLLIGLMGTALLLTLSRGGLLSFLLASGGCVLCLLFKAASSSDRQASLWRYIVFAVLLLVFIVIYVGWIGFSPIAHRSLIETFFPGEQTFRKEIRFTLWRNALTLVKEFPLFGSGLGTFEYVFARYRPEMLPQHQYPFHAHNDYLELLIEMGIPGLLIALWAIGRFFRYGLRKYVRHTDPVLTALVLGGLTSILAMAIHSFWDFNLQIPANALLFVIVLALTTAAGQIMTLGHLEHQRTRHPERVPRNGKVYRLKPSWKGAVGMIALGGLLLFNFRDNLAMKYYSQAKTAQLQGLPLLAIPFYQKALTFDNGDAMLHAALAELFNALGKMSPHSEKWYAWAVQEYHKALTLNPYDAGYYYYLGRTYHALDRQAEAVEAFEQAIVYNPRMAFYHEKLGDYFLSINQIDAALKRYRKAVELDPHRLADIFKACQEYHLSYAQYQQLVPENAESHKLFADLLARQGDWETSLAEYRKAIQASGQRPEYYEALLGACRTKRDYQCMRATWQELVEQQPANLDLRVKIAESFGQQKLWDQAIQQYQTLLAEHPEQTQLRQRLAELQQQQGQSAEAIRTYLEIIERTPENVRPYHAIADLYRQQKQWQAAISIYETALEHGVTQAAIYANLGDLYLQLGDQNKAVELYDQAIQAGENRLAVYQALEHLYQTPHADASVELLWETYRLVNRDKPEALFQLVTQYHKRGEWLNAVNLCKELLVIAPKNAHYRKFLADLYEREGMLAQAIAQWEKLVNMSPNSVEYNLYLAGLYEQAQQPEKARRQYQKVLQIQPNHQHAQQKLASLGG